MTASAPVERVGEDGGFAVVLGPALGAVAGGFAIAMGADRLGMDRERTALGAAALGVATALGSSGWMRAIASGVAAAGIATFIAHLLAPAAKARAPEDAPDRPEQAQQNIRTGQPEARGDRCIAVAPQTSRASTGVPSESVAKSADSASSPGDLADPPSGPVEPFGEVASRFTETGRTRRGEPHRVPTADVNGTLLRPSPEVRPGALASQDHARPHAGGR